MRGFGESGRLTHQNKSSSPSSTALPIPFNIPIVLHNILFNDLDLGFSMKLQDMLETVRFAYNAQKKMQKRYAKREAEIQALLLSDAENLKLKHEYEEIQLDRLQASYDFRDLITALSDMMSREQFEKLLKFSNISV